MKDFLQRVKEYIESVEEQIDGEWGACRSVDELIADNVMPDLYDEIISMLNDFE